MTHPDLVLVTRSRPAGQLLLQTLQDAGWPAVDACPVRLTGAASPDSLQKAFEQLLPLDLVILTSAEGLRRSVSLLGADRMSQCPIIVPGPGSRSLARELGLTGVVAPERAGSSEDMLALPELRQVAGKRALILAAAGGRQLLGAELSRRGAKVHRLHVYRRRNRALPLATLRAIGQCRQPTTLLASAGALTGLYRQLDPVHWQRLQGGWMVAPSERVAAMAAEHGCERVWLADGADDAAMLAALRACTQGARMR
ncbi:MAG: uroporphyrinogen-III synthase [Wenzhouxiangella sp.]|nr:uroporphyrinogen-III synthase [Wenzhouxiangella sp.]MCH8478316.1 uroporphyrinogen-III synthase [Wenzhouxiangella sp.]TVR96948.1 MAG: uroporphyrinogen-III synthase [Wenzhouxiangellaceae bacterium]